MSIKTYGIYLAFPPTVELNHEGLGRYLAAFLGHAANRSDIRFLVACPSWFKEPLLRLCKDEGVPVDSFDLLTPAGKPAILQLYEAYLAYKNRSKGSGKFKRTFSHLITFVIQRAKWFEKKLVTSRSAGMIVLALACTALIQCILLPSYVLLVGGRLVSKYIYKSASPYLKKIHHSLMQPKNHNLFLRLYKFMEQGELEILLRQINQCTHVKAWFCHTAFWPSFNRINAPRLMCVPDVVMTEFAIGFSDVGGDRFLENFKAVEQAILGAEHFVTYSDHIKTNTLVEKYAIHPEAIHVVRHAPNDLSHWIKVHNFPDTAGVEKNYCQYLLITALQKSPHHEYVNCFTNKSVKFLFYASQFRPSKNILTLLRAYEYLLRKKYIQCKLILTGNLQVMPLIERFIVKHKLEKDVLCLHALSSTELAACYKLAELAVNPSLSEGGCPFTFTEALSVGTPVVMGRIPVTEEVITDPALQEMMLFDPYDWRSMANRIEWALLNSSELLAAQLKTYNELSQRTWEDVVSEHIAILDQISSDKPHVITHMSDYTENTYSSSVNQN